MQIRDGGEREEESRTDGSIGRACGSFDRRVVEPARAAGLALATPTPWRRSLAATWWTTSRTWCTSTTWRDASRRSTGRRAGHGFQPRGSPGDAAGRPAGPGVGRGLPPDDRQHTGQRLALDFRSDSYAAGRRQLRLEVTAASCSSSGQPCGVIGVAARRPPARIGGRPAFVEVGGGQCQRRGADRGGQARRSSGRQDRLRQRGLQPHDRATRPEEAGRPDATHPAGAADRPRPVERRCGRRSRIGRPCGWN